MAKRYYNKRINGKKDSQSTQKSDTKSCDEDTQVPVEDNITVDDQALATKEESNTKHTTGDADVSPKEDAWAKKMTTLYRFIHQIIMILYRQGENTESQCVQFALMAGQSADFCGFEQVAYDFFLDAFKVYEESVSHSKAQFNAIVYSIGSLLKTSTRFASQHYYSTLSTKITLYCTKLLKKPDQSRSIYLSSHLWVSESPSRVLECLQKSLKIADSCMDTVTNELLFLELLNQYTYHYEKENPMVISEAYKVKGGLR